MESAARPAAKAPVHAQGDPKTKLQAIGIAVNPAVALFMLVLNKLWDPLAEYMGFPPIDLQLRMDEQRHAMQRLVAIRDDYILTDPCPASHQASIWLRRVEQLQEDDSSNNQHYITGNFLTIWRCAREATKLTKRAEDAATQFKELGMQVKPRPHPVKGSDWNGMSMVTSPYTECLMSFINERPEQCRLGIWGMAGVGKTSLLRYVARSLSEDFASDTSFRILSVDVGTECTLTKLQKSICGLLGLTLDSEVTEWGMSHAISNRLMGMNFVLILDNLSYPIDLQRLGIPDPSRNHPPLLMLNSHVPSVPSDPQSSGADSTAKPLNPVAAGPDSAKSQVVIAVNDEGVTPRRVIIRCQKVVITTQKQSVCASMCCHRMMQMLPPDEKEATQIFSHAVGIDVMNDQTLATLAEMIIKECGCLPEALYKVGCSLSIKRSPEEWELTLKMLRQGRLAMVTHKSDDLINRLKRSYEDLDENAKECFLICSMWNEEENIPVEDLVQMWRGKGLVDQFDGHAEGYGYIRMLQQSSLLEVGDNNLISSECSHVRMNGMIHKLALQILTEKKVKWAANSPRRSGLTEDKWKEIENVWASTDDVGLLRGKRFLRRKLSSRVSFLVTRCPIELSRCQFDAIVFLDMEMVNLGTVPLAICSMVTLQYLNLSSTEISSIPAELGALCNLKSLRLRFNVHLSEIPEGLLVQLEKLIELDLFGTGCLMTPILQDEFEQSDLNHLLLGVTLKSETEVTLWKQLCRVSTFCISLEDFDNISINLDMFSACKRLRELRISGCNVVSLVAQRQDEIEDPRSVLNSLRSIEILNAPFLTEISLRAFGLNVTSVSISCACELVELTWIADLLNLVQISVYNCAKISTLVSSTMTDLLEVKLPRLKKVDLSRLPQLLSLSDLPMQLENIVHFGVTRCCKLTGLPVKKRDQKVILDCDEDFWQNISQGSKAAGFNVRVDGNWRAPNPRPS